MYDNSYIILIDSSSTRDIQINRRDNSDENYDDWTGGVVIDTVSATTLEEALELVSDEYEISVDKLYGYRICGGTYDGRP